jgi:hypothetical protein
MKSSLDLLRKASTLSFGKGEEILDSYTASYDAGSAGFSSWRLGNLHLTEKRLLFVQVRKLLFQIPLCEIQRIDLIKRRWILGKRVTQLYIQWNSSRTRNVFIAIKDPLEWKKNIENMSSSIL